MSQKPVFNLVRNNEPMLGGASTLNNNGIVGHQYEPESDDYYEYKARKYHTKIQVKLRQMMNEGKQCPVGYEKYLEPFKA